MRWFLRVLAAAVVLAAGMGNAQPAPKRIALIVANANYAGYDALPNTATDAGLVRETLTRAGFASIEVKLDLGIVDFRAALAKFRVAATDADVALVYFAGHGVEAVGRNWLIPTDASLASEADFAQQAIDVADVFAAMGSARTRIAVLDACRNNPFAVQLRESGSASVGRGLGAPTGATGLAAPTRAGDAGQGVLLMYSAAPGNTAEDGPDGQGSPFARAFQKHFSEPDVELRSAAGNIRATVATETQDGQLPFLTLSLTGAPIVFLRGEDVPGPPAPTRPGAVFRDCPECPLMVVVPAGRFRMGSPQSDSGVDNETGGANEILQHEVTVGRAFAAGKFEVTSAEWNACVAAGGCTLPDDGSAGPSDKYKGDNFPVVNVSWRDARNYVAWLNRRVGGGSYRLLTEAQWEYAARAGSSSAYFWGADRSAGCTWANVGDSAFAKAFGGSEWATCDDGFGRESAPVGSFRANAFGLHDTAGNVWEWVEDCYIGRYTGEATDSSAVEFDGCPRRAVRGNNWGGEGRSAARMGVPPSARFGDTGFRVARRL